MRAIVRADPFARTLWPPKARRPLSISLRVHRPGQILFRRRREQCSAATGCAPNINARPASANQAATRAMIGARRRQPNRGPNLRPLLTAAASLVCVAKVEQL